MAHLSGAEAARAKSAGERQPQAAAPRDMLPAAIFNAQTHDVQLLPAAPCFLRVFTSIELAVPALKDAASATCARRMQAAGSSQVCGRRGCCAGCCAGCLQLWRAEKPSGGGLGGMRALTRRQRTPLARADQLVAGSRQAGEPSHFSWSKRPRASKRNVHVHGVDSKVYYVVLNLCPYILYIQY